MNHFFTIAATLVATSFSSAKTEGSAPIYCSLSDHSGHNHTLHQINNQAPISLMGGHVHEKGEWMFSYRYMRMDMDRNYSGTSEVNDSAVLAGGFAVTPTNMTMEMHMFGAMHAVTDRLTLMGMLNLVEMSMDHLTGMSTRFNTKSSGIGDASLTALLNLKETSNSSLVVGLGVILPTAGVKETDRTPLGPNSRLPYPMQLGAGTWGIRPSLTYTAGSNGWAWGAQARATIYLDENSEGWRPGHRGELTGWVSRRFNEQWSTSFRLKASTWEDVEGSDSRVARIVPTAIPSLRGGSRIEAGLGLNYEILDSAARISCELTQPVWQDVDSFQLVPSWTATVGVQYTF